MASTDFAKTSRHKEMFTRELIDKKYDVSSTNAMVLLPPLLRKVCFDPSPCGSDGWLLVEFEKCRFCSDAAGGNDKLPTHHPRRGEEKESPQT
jgi:hypothetical protein